MGVLAVAVAAATISQDAPARGSEHSTCARLVQKGRAAGGCVETPLRLSSNVLPRLVVSGGARPMLVATARVRSPRRGIVRLVTYRADRRGQWAYVASRTARLRHGRFRAGLVRYRRGGWKVQVTVVPARTLTGAPVLAESRHFVTPPPGPLRGGRYLAAGAPVSRAEARWVQTRLSHAGFRVPRDGRLGRRSAAAIRRFQHVHGLLVDAIVGRQTASALRHYARAVPTRRPGGRGVDAPEVGVTDPTVSSPAGEVNFLKANDSAFDKFTADPTQALKDWMNQKYTRLRTFPPYFDSRLSWFPDAWAYQNLYAIYSDDRNALAREHPEWILRDAQNRKMYIPFDCDGTTCPQYAGDIGNPDFRAHRINRITEMMARGYRGVFLDDVNMEMRVGDAASKESPPVDPRTGRPMTLQDWRRYVAEFTEQIRAALPDKEIVHNAIWWSGYKDDPYIVRQLRSADFIGLEHGVDDDGIQGGGGQFGYLTFMDRIDWLHDQGKAVIFDANPKTEARREYNLASYFLASTGRDLIGSDLGGRPDDWWAGYDVSLGADRGERFEWRGLLRRDFDNGFVLVNRPGEPTRTVTFDPPVRGPAGDERTSVTLAGAQGAVLVGTVPPGGPAAGAKPVASEASTGTGSAGAWTGKASVVMQRQGNLVLRGRTRPGRAATVRIVVRRKAGARWIVARRVAVRSSARGRFSRRITRLAAGRYRIRATLRGGSVHISSRVVR